MAILCERKRRACPSVPLRALTLGVCLLGFAGLVQVEGQNAAAQSQAVTVKSDPAGAMIWKKDGLEYTCTSTATPGTVALAFHGDNDVQRLQVRRFGYSPLNLDVKLTDSEVGGALKLSNGWSSSFMSASDAPADFIKLNETLMNAFETTLLSNQEAFRCAPFDLSFFHLVKNRETGDIDLLVALRLDRAFGGSALRLASNGPKSEERQHKMGQVALENGVAEVLARVRRIIAGFSEIKRVVIVCSHRATTPVLDTATTSRAGLEYHYEYGHYDVAQNRMVTVVVGQVVRRTDENTVVKDVDAEETITFVMPIAQIPETLDQKTITDAVLAVGSIDIKSVHE